MKQLDADWVEYDLSNTEDLNECYALTLIGLNFLDTLLQNKDNINAVTMQEYGELQYLKKKIEQRKEDNRRSEQYKRLKRRNYEQ